MKLIKKLNQKLGNKYMPHQNVLKKNLNISQMLTSLKSLKKKSKNIKPTNAHLTIEYKLKTKNLKIPTNANFY